MKSRKNGKSRNDQPEGLVELITRVPGGYAVYKSGVAEGLSWAASSTARSTARYSSVRHEDVIVTAEAATDTPGWMSVSIAFPGRFEPPPAYGDGLPEASIHDDAGAMRVFWIGWLDGVHEAEARTDLAPLLAAIPARKVLVMEPPQPTECPVCWIERNLGVKVVIKGRDEKEG